MHFESTSYHESGVNIQAGYRAVELIKKHAARTKIPGLISSLGGFSGCFEPDLKAFPNPVLVSGADGVGTKLKIAFLLDKHDTIGIDCVAMCVNDILCAGAKPLFFLDYLAMSKNIPERVESIVSGVAEGCVQAGCALIGGETAEMPGFYMDDEYDLAGFAVGLAEKSRILNGNALKAGDIILALPSSGIHSNGFSLVRLVIDKAKANIHHCYEGFTKPLGEILLTPTKIYVHPILALLTQVKAPAISHITGGGFYENIPRSLRNGLSAKINIEALNTPDIFRFLKNMGHISEHDMFNTFNMGVGMCVIVPEKQADIALNILKTSGEPDAYIIGEIVPGNREVILC